MDQGRRDEAWSHLFLVVGTFPHDKLPVDYAAYESLSPPGTDRHVHFWEAPVPRRVQAANRTTLRGSGWSGPRGKLQVKLGYPAGAETAGGQVFASEMAETFAADRSVLMLYGTTLLLSGL